MREFLARHSDCVVLATCRRRQNQGRFNGSIDEQVRLLEAVAAAGAKAVDLEIESAESAPAALAHLRTAGPVIVSYHNFEATPAVDAVVRRMHRCPADAYKIVTTARKPTDIARLLASLEAARQDPDHRVFDGGGRLRVSSAVSAARRAVHVCRALHGRGNRAGPGERA